MFFFHTARFALKTALHCISRFFGVGCVIISRHHLIALLRECKGRNNYPDHPNNLIEHASRPHFLDSSIEPDFAELIEDLDANGNGTGTTKSGTLPTRSRIVHRSNHPQYTRWIQLLLYTELEDKGFRPDKSDWIQGDCDVMERILTTVQNRVHNLFVLNKIPTTTTLRNPIKNRNETLTLLARDTSKVGNDVYEAWWLK
jgi:hypothetical protein